MKRHPKVFILIIGIIVVLITGAIAIIYTMAEPGWHSRDGVKTYYNTDWGKKARGYTLIKGKPYYFTREGKPHDRGWIESSAGERFYSEGSGKLTVGWKYIDRKVWYFYNGKDSELFSDDIKECRTGTLIRNTETTGKIRIPEDGGIGGEEGLALAYAIDVLDRYGWNLHAAYRYSGHLRFIEGKSGKSNDFGETTDRIALYGFKNGKGNCLVWSGTLCAMAKLLGHDARHVWGQLWFHGKLYNHAWMEIWVKGEEEPHVFDPRKNEGQDLAGFNRHYGDKGIYKYHRPSITYLEWK